MSTETTKIGLPPIAPGDARLFILGSLPGDASLAAGRYFAHPTNQFWRLLGEVVGEELAGMGYDQRLQSLADRRIALWDVIASANRRGSLDQAIRDAQHNRIEHLLRDYPDLRAIAFNGATASAAGRKLIGTAPPRLQLLDLPSSSAANTQGFAQKLEGWRQLAQFVQP